MRKYFFMRIGHLAAAFFGVMLSAAIIKTLVDESFASSSGKNMAILPTIDHEPAPDDSKSYKNAIVTEIVPIFHSGNKTIPKNSDIKKQGAKNSQYKVGLFESVNGLQLTVFNTSPNFIDKVFVTVDFIKPDGELMQSENVIFSSIKSKDAQTISIPGSDSGMIVRYKIIKVYSHNCEVTQRIA